MTNPIRSTGPLAKSPSAPLPPPPPPPPPPEAPRPGTSPAAKGATGSPDAMAAWTAADGPTCDVPIAAYDGPDLMPTAPTEGVQEKIDHAFQDDKDTAEDLKKAMGRIESPDDVAAVLAAADALGIDKRPLLREAVKELDEGADPPQAELIEAIAAGYEDIGYARTAAAMEGLTNDALDKDLRKDLILALQDDKDTLQDLKDAASHADSAAEFDAIMAVAAAKECSNADRHAILQAALFELDQGADVLDTDVIAAVAEQYDKLAEADPAYRERAEAVHSLLTEGLPKDVREKLIEALDDNHHTSDEMRDALDALAEWKAANPDADATAYQDATDQAGEATLGEGAYAALGMEASLDHYTALASEMAEAEQAKALALQSGAIPPDQVDAFVAQFEQENQALYDDFEAAEAELAAIAREHPEALAGLLTADPPPEGVDLDKLQTGLQMLANSPTGYQAAEAVMAAVYEAAPAAPSDDVKERLEGLTEAVAAPIMQQRMAAIAAEHPDATAEQMMTMLEGTPMFDAMGAAVQAKDYLANATALMEGVEDLRIAAGKGASAFGDALKAQMANGPLGKSLAVAGVITGAMAFKDDVANGEFADAIVDLAGTTEDAAMLMQQVGRFQSFSGSFGTASTALGKVAAPLAAALSAKDAVGEFQAFLETGDTTQLAQAGMSAGIAAASVVLIFATPGVGQVAALAIVGLSVGKALLSALSGEDGPELPDYGDPRDTVMPALEKAGIALTPLQEALITQRVDVDSTVDELRTALEGTGVPPESQMITYIYDAIKANPESPQAMVDMLYEQAKGNPSERAAFEAVATALGVDPKGYDW